jgi:hypothetical protein
MTMQAIEIHPVYKQVLKDSFGGIMYNVSNLSKYDSKEVLELWDNMTIQEQNASGGIMKGAIGFLKGE